MNCPNCGGDLLAFTVPANLCEYVPDERAHVGICERCLQLEPVEDAPDDDPNFTEISDAFPSNAEAALPMALLVGLLPSLALHRNDIEALLEHVERAGVDPFLVLDRLADDPALDPAVDLRRRRSQLLQMME